MHKMEELRDMLCEELEKITAKGELSAGSLDAVDKLTHSIKSIDTILAMEEYSEDDEYSSRRYSRGGRSYASPNRGRGSNARRDSMGRYTSRYDGRSERGYSRDEAKEELKDQLQDLKSMYKGTEVEHMINKWIRQADE